MIIYKDILKKLDEAGYSTYQLRKEKVLSESVISRLRNKRKETEVYEKTKLYSNHTDE